MSTSDLDKFYVSPYDQFLFEFDANHKPSESQLSEIKKHQRIAKMRDNADYIDEKGEIWESF